MNKYNNNKGLLKKKPDHKLNDFVKNPEEITEKEATPVLTIKPMNDYIQDAKKKPIPNQLFGELWFEGEVCMMFSDTNNGKSVLAVQISENIAKGTPILTSEETKAKRVAYLDIELSDKQIEARYSQDYKNHYKFSNNLLRLVTNPSNISTNINLEDQVLNEIIKISKEKQIKIFVIDNITALVTDFEKSKNAIELMKRLRSLKNDLGLSFLVLAHTPKRDKSKEITIDHLSGSKQLSNQCDSMFAIGRSISDEKIRYIKQLKARFVEIKYGSNNIITCHIEKSQDNMLKFKFDGESKERFYLMTFNNDELDKRARKIIELRDVKKMSYENIAKEMGIVKSTVYKIYKKAKNNETGS